MCDKPQIGDVCCFMDYIDDPSPYIGIFTATTSDGRFVTGDTVYNYCKKVKKTVTVVRKASDIIKWCEEHGYKWHQNGLTSPDFMRLPDLFWDKIKYCGENFYTIPAGLNYHEDWLEEKEV